MSVMFQLMDTTRMELSTQLPTR